MRRPKEVSPFKCCGPCDRVRISMRSKEDERKIGWSGPNKSPYGGLYCKDCYDSEKFMKEIGICREQDNIIQTENIGDWWCICYGLVR